MRRLSELLADTTILRAGGDSDILAIPVEPRQLAQRELFFKLRSRHVRISAKDAIRQGARYVVLEAGDDEEATLPPDIPYLVVDDVNRAFARSCARIFDDAHRQLTLIGVTGAKGKTTVCHLIDAGLRATGIRTGLMSSLVFRLPESQRPAAISIPESAVMSDFLVSLSSAAISGFFSFPPFCSLSAPAIRYSILALAARQRTSLALPACSK